MGLTIKNTRQNKSSNLTEFNKKDKDFREELRINSSDLLVGMVSCFKPQKSPQDFIRLAYLVNKSLYRMRPYANRVDKSLNKTVGAGVKFILIGDGVLRKKIEGLISKFDLGQQVILTGWREDIPRILSALDIFVLTSLWEGLPISVLEAMVVSLPVIATNTGGISEVLLEGRTGFLVSPGNVDKMAEKLIGLLKDKSLRDQIGQSARDSLGSIFSLEDMLRSTENSYQDLIKERLPEKNGKI
ncbi:MAG: glycosyltransferase [Candidatus Omnitrophica bacterium]|nr:glycosyltransferase [Candidatus Omnitrophota bacterium]